MCGVLTLVALFSHICLWYLEVEPQAAETVVVLCFKLSFSVIVSKITEGALLRSAFCYPL